MSSSEQPARMSLGATIRADLQTFADIKRVSLETVGGLLDVLLFPGVMTVILFRLANACHRAGVRPISRLLYILNVVLFGADIAPGMHAEPGLAIPHPVGVTLGSDVRLGRQVRIFQGVNIGGAAYEDRTRDGMPTIGDGCYIFSGARVLGPITVGHDAMIGTNAVVFRAVPPGALMAGNPAELLRYREGFKPQDSNASNGKPSKGDLRAATGIAG